MKIRNSEGFTLIETLIAITLVSLIGLTVFIVTSDIVSFTGNIKDLNRWNKELIQLERVLRKSVAEVKFPFWISDVEVIEGTGIIKVPYWNGDVNSLLEMKIEDTAFKITTPEGSTVFTGYDGVELGFLKDSGLRTIGLSILIKKDKKDNLIFQCAFGSIGREVFNRRL